MSVTGSSLRLLYNFFFIILFTFLYNAFFCIIFGKKWNLFHPRGSWFVFKYFFGLIFTKLRKKMLKSSLLVKLISKNPFFEKKYGGPLAISCFYEKVFEKNSIWERRLLHRRLQVKIPSFDYWLFKIHHQQPPLLQRLLLHRQLLQRSATTSSSRK